jgi:hypothetical protein
LAGHKNSEANQIMKCIVCHSDKPDSDFPQIIGGEIDQGQSSVGDKIVGPAKIRMESLKHLRICKKDWDDLPRVQVIKKAN